MCVCVCIAEHFACPARASNLIIKPTSANSNATASATTTTTEHNNNNTTQFLKNDGNASQNWSRPQQSARACVCLCVCSNACVRRVHAQMHTLALIWVALYGNLYGPTQLHVCLHSGNATRSPRVVCHVSCPVQCCRTVARFAVKSIVK